MTVRITAITGWLHHANGQPVREQHYHAPGRCTFRDASVRIEHAVAEGQVLTIHSGYGVTNEYTVIAADGTTALLQRT